MIDEEATKERYGYYSTDLKPKSSKKVIAICDGCGKVREIMKYNYHGLCRSCGRRVEKIKCVCKRCKKEFEVFPSGIKRGEGKFCSRECYSKYNVGKNNSFYGKKHSKKTRNKISKNHYDCSLEKHPNWKGGEVKRVCQECGKIFYCERNKIGKGGGKYCSRSCVRKNIKFPTHHTKPELIFEDICQRNNLPFKYVGDGNFWIDNINPDFVECNGKKLAIEIFGDYWHSPLLNYKLREDRTFFYRKKQLKKYGWKLVVFWETDVLREDAEAFILKKIEGL